MTWPHGHSLLYLLRPLTPPADYSALATIHDVDITVTSIAWMRKLDNIEDFKIAVPPTLSFTLRTVLTCSRVCRFAQQGLRRLSWPVQNGNFSDIVPFTFLAAPPGVSPIENAAN